MKAKGASSQAAVEKRMKAAKELEGTIKSQVEEFLRSEKWFEFLEYARKFHSYSFRNILLIMAQQPAASQVAGYRKWLSLGRQVKKGERAIKIFGYATGKVRTAANLEEAEAISEGVSEVEAKELTYVYFPIVNVFDISQTEAIEGESDQTVQLLAPLEGGDDAGIFGIVKAFIESQGWEVCEKEIKGKASGYMVSQGRKIVLKKGLSHAQATKTLIHETAHALMHENISRTEYHMNRSRYEVEAESVAYIVAGAFGMDTKGYSVGYIAAWANRDTEVITEAGNRIMNTVKQLIDGIENQH